MKWIDGGFKDRIPIDLCGCPEYQREGIIKSHLVKYGNLKTTTAEKYLDKMENAGYIKSYEEPWGERKKIIYTITKKGIVHTLFRWNGKTNFYKGFLKGITNTFTCTNCSKLGFSKEIVTISLETRGEIVYFKPIFPDEERVVKEEMGFLCFYEPLGEPLLLLVQFLDDYKKKLEKEGYLKKQSLRDMIL